MGIKIGAPFLKLLRRQRITTVHPAMIFLSPSRSSSINDTNGGMKLRLRSEENLKKLGECMNSMDDDVSTLFTECHQTDLREDPELFLLLNNYFTTTKGLSILCDSLKKFLGSAENNECLMIDEAVRDFDEETLSYGGLLEASFRKTFQDLRNFNDFYNGIDRDLDHSDFLAGDFLRKFQICHQDLSNMIVKLETTMKQIDKKLKHVRGRRAIFMAALLLPVIAAIFVSKIVAGIFGLVPMDALTTFISSKWKKSTEFLKREKIALTSMERATLVALKEVDKISKLVSKLESVERSIRVTAESAVKKRSSVAVAMGGMKKKRKWLTSMLVDLDTEPGRCDGFAQFGRKVAREKIAEFLSRGEKCSKY